MMHVFSSWTDSQNLSSCFYVISKAGNQFSVAVDEDATSNHLKRREEEIVLEKESAFPKENGEQRSNGLRTDLKYDKTADRQPDIVDDHPGKSRSSFDSCHTSVILYAYGFFQIWTFIMSWWAGAEAWVLKGSWVRVWVLVPGGVRSRVQV